MVKAIKEEEEAMEKYHLPIGIKFFMFIKRIRFRIFVLCSIGALFYYWGNLLGMASGRLTRVYKKYKRRWIYRFNRPAFTNISALETLYVPEKLSRESTDKLSALFVKLDSELDLGFSRQLVADVLVKMELMKKKEEMGKFLDASGHNYIRSKKLNSMSLKEFLEVLESKFCTDDGSEAEYVETFIKVTEEEKNTFLDRAYADIKEAEMTPYEHR